MDNIRSYTHTHSKPVMLNAVKHLFRRCSQGSRSVRNQREYCVYIMSNISKTLYVGVTSNLERRVWEHRQKHSKGFTQRYNCTMLVHVECFPWVDDAIAREKQLKGWKRDRKMALVREENPDWLDLAADWFR